MERRPNGIKNKEETRVKRSLNRGCSRRGKSSTSKRIEVESERMNDHIGSETTAKIIQRDCPAVRNFGQ